MPIIPYLRKESGFYHLRGTHLGVRVDRSSGTRSHEHARILAAKEEKEIFERFAYGAKAVETFAGAAADYLRAGGEAEHMTPLIEHFGLTKLRDIDQAALDAFALRHMPDVQPSTRRRKIYTPFIACWNHAVAGNKAEPRKWKRPDAGRKRVEWRTPEEMEALMAALKPATRALVTFYLGSGARASEALNAVWSDFSPAAHRVTLWGDITKNEQERFVDLCPRAREALPARRGPTDPVFLNTHGQPWHAYDAVNLALRRGCKRANVRHTSCHILRHTWATWRYAVTRDLRKLMDQGGWASPELAMRYTHAGTDDLADAVKAHGWEQQGSGVSPGVKIIKEAK